MGGMRCAQQFPRAVEDLWLELRGLEDENATFQRTTETLHHNLRPLKNVSPIISFDSSPAETESEKEEENKPSVNLAEASSLQLSKTDSNELLPGRQDHPLMLVRALLTHPAGLNAFPSQLSAHQTPITS